MIDSQSEVNTHLCMDTVYHTVDLFRFDSRLKSEYSLMSYRYSCWKLDMPLMKYLIIYGRAYTHSMNIYVQVQVICSITPDSLFVLITFATVSYNQPIVADSYFLLSYFIFLKKK